MAHTGGLAGRRALMDVAEQFGTWRSSRKRGEKIPRGLWQAAVRLAGHYSLDEIAATLSLDFGRLEKRVEAVTGARKRPGGSTAPVGYRGFVEVGTLGAGYPDGCTIEAVDRSGNKLSIHLKGSGCAQATEAAMRVATALWSNGR